MLPLVEEIPFQPPVESFPSFLRESYPLLLDSSLADPRLGRYSYIMADPFIVLKSKGTQIELWERGGSSKFCGDPFAVLQDLLRQRGMEHVEGLPPFQGGAAGYLGYDLCHHLEELPQSSLDDVGLPHMCLGFYDIVAAYDHTSRRAWLIASGDGRGDDAGVRQRLSWAKERLQEPPAEGDFSSSTKRKPRPALRSNFTHSDYIKAILAAKEYIAAGDIYQVNLSQRFQTPLRTHPWALYRHLRQTSPVPFAAYFDFGDGVVLSASMEQFLKLEKGLVETRPIKGTRRRGRNPDEDRAQAQALQASIKDKAENVMIVDLLRNDLGRVCRIGSVSVPELYTLEAYAMVYHLVSTVVGQLIEGHDAVDLLRATFPGGSVTGCPKIRSMEIIDELEPTQRGIYCGSIGYLGFSGTMNTSIVIRTMVATNGTVYFQMGGAIVADSDPDSEYQETLDKARASVVALQML